MPIKSIEVKTIQSLMKMNPPLNEFSKHIILYAKGHYKKSQLNEAGEGLCFYDDLVQIVASISGSEVRHISSRDVDFHVIRTLVETGSSEQLINTMCGFLSATDPTKMINMALSTLAGIQIVENDIKLWDIGKPDPKILPLSSKGTTFSL